MIIIGYIHVCQIGQWQNSFDMIMQTIKGSGLYDATQEIRVGVVNNAIGIIPDERFNDPKIVLVANGPASNYERTTLSHMRNYANTDPCCQYWYCHTKGIRFFDSSNEFEKNCVISWIKLMIHWNFAHWKIATEKLKSYDTYGCDFSPNPVPHYSGNFWWANSHYIRTLSYDIGPNYCDPEFWLLRRGQPYDPPIMCNIYSTGIDGGHHYSNISHF